MKNPKMLRSALSLAICIVAIIVCLNAANKFESEHASTNYTPTDSVSIGSYSITDYSYYGGDAYTGIQQAGADASNNVAVLGITATEGINMLYTAHKNAANNVAALAAPVNAVTASVAAIGSMLSTAMAFAFALPGLKYLFDLLQAIREAKEASASVASPAVLSADSELPAKSESETEATIENI